VYGLLQNLKLHSKRIVQYTQSSARTQNKLKITASSTQQTDSSLSLSSVPSSYPVLSANMLLMAITDSGMRATLQNERTHGVGTSQTKSSAYCAEYGAPHSARPYHLYYDKI
jgi:hypothetical protein